ncbi:hypothetical protein [Methylicorpusculum oleiharenae]|nr:hypothetical protein [Methylicorpusculum oleiharenae]
MALDSLGGLTVRAISRHSLAGAGYAGTTATTHANKVLYQAWTTL